MAKVRRPCVNVRPAHVGTWVPKTITSGTCANNSLAVISTLAECEEAALKLQGTTQVEESAEQLLPFCSQIRGIFYFDSTGMDEEQGIHGCSEDYVCVCKQGAVHHLSSAAPLYLTILIRVLPNNSCNRNCRSTS